MKKNAFFGAKEGAKLILCASFIFFCFALVGVSAGNAAKDILTENSLNVNSLAVDKKMPIIVIDPGHGGADGGAVAPNGTLEKDLNLDLAIKLRDMLAFSGYDIVMTRCDDSMYFKETSSASKKVQDTRHRVDVTKDYENCIFVSIHMNKFPSEKYSGLQVYYSDKTEGSRELAESIQSLTKELLQKDNDRHVKKSNSTIYVLDKAERAAVLVECGFLSNPTECEKLSSESYRKELAELISRAIESYISSTLQKDVKK